MKPQRTLFYDVDTQRDFILPGGLLYIDGTERVIPALAALTRIARTHGIKIVASADCHTPDDPELQRNGGRWPDHCMRGTSGQKKIDETAARNAMIIENVELADAQIDAALAHRGQILIHKQRFDVISGNRNAEKLLRRLLHSFEDVVIYGVYTEVCVDHAVQGLLKMRGPKLHVVVDAIAPIGPDAPACIEAWRAAGVDLLTVQDLKEQLDAT
ncbi:MAG: cysteine hydrolase family protein [Candidatus Binataceae bacterium]